MKTCRHCGEQKATGEFPANRRCRDGLSSWCRACHDEASARSRIKKIEREAPIIEAQRKEAHAEFMAKWRASIRQRQKQIARNRRALERRKQAT